MSGTGDPPVAAGNLPGAHPLSPEEPRPVATSHSSLPLPLSPSKSSQSSHAPTLLRFSHSCETLPYLDAKPLEAYIADNSDRFLKPNPSVSSLIKASKGFPRFSHSSRLNRGIPSPQSPRSAPASAKSDFWPFLRQFHQIYGLFHGRTIKYQLLY